METKEIITMIVEILVGLSILVGAIVFIVRWCVSITNRVSKIEDKIDNLPSEIENRIIKQFLPFAISVIDSQNNPLPKEDIERMRRLMRKLQDNSITQEETKILKGLLEIEKEEAEQKNNANLILAIGIALAAIGLMVAAFSKKK